MLERREQNNERRRESRTSAGDRIAWTRSGQNLLLRGWLSDKSPTSVSFIASREFQPTRGETIEVITRDQTRTPYCVTRTAPYDDKDLSLVAATRQLGAALVPSAEALLN